MIDERYYEGYEGELEVVVYSANKKGYCRKKFKSTVKTKEDFSRFLNDDSF